MNTFALMQVQVDGSPDEIASISGFDFSWILEDPEDENIEDLIVLTLFRNYFAFISMNHASLPFTDMNPDSTQMIFGVVEDYSTLNGHTQDSASLTCFNESILKDLLDRELQLGEEARGLPLEEFLELARPHLPPSLEVIQNPITLRIVRATLPPPLPSLPPLMPTALMDSSPSNYIDVFDIIKEKISNREDVLEGSHTVAKYYPDGDYIEFVAECGLYFGMEETGNFQIEVESDNSSNGNAGFSISLSGIKEWFNINLGNQKFFDMYTPNLDDGDYYFNLEQEESGSYKVYLSIYNLSGRRLGINIDSDADILLIESDWTHEEEYSGRGIIVNEIPYGISNIQFKTWNTYLEVPNYLPDTVTSLERTFESCNNFNSYISDWDTSRVRSMSHTFYGCESFNQDISIWDVSNVENMEYAFIGASSFTSDLSYWDVGKVENFDYTFSGARNFDSDLSQWDTSSAWSMFRMFSSASSFSSIVEDWDVSNVENMDYMFQSTSGETTSLPPQDLSRWCVTKVPFYPSGFIDYDWAGTLPIWGTCPSGDTVEMGLRADYSGSGWYKATDTGTVFNRGVPALETHVFSDSPTEYVSVHIVEDAKLYGSRAAVSNITAMDSLFEYEEAFNEDISSWDVSNVTDMSLMFEGAISFNQDISSWDVSSVTNMNSLFYEATEFNQDLSSWDVSNVTDMEYMFGDTTSFTSDLSSWDVSSVTNMGNMFYATDSFNQDLSSWDVSNVTNMYGMFQDATAFNEDISNWDVSSVTDMSLMFYGATSFNSNISMWDVSNVTRMQSMFDNAASFNSDISTWDVSSVTVMNYMFHNATSFNQDLSGWCVSPIATKPDYFDFGTTAWSKPSPVWGTCPTPKDPLDYFYGNFNYPKNPSDPDFKGEPPAPDSPPDGDMRILGYKWESTPYGFREDNPAVIDVLSTTNRVFNTEEELIQGVLDFARDYFEADARYRVENYPASIDYTVDFSTLKIKFNNNLPYPDKVNSEGLRASKSRIRSYVRADFCNVSGSNVPSVLNSFSQHAAITVDVKQNGNISEAGGTLNLGVAIWCN